MKRNEVNFALIMVILALSTALLVNTSSSPLLVSRLRLIPGIQVGFWFPLALRRVIRQSVPKVDRFTEMGVKRTNAEMDREYHRLLARDRNPFAFLYNGEAASFRYPI